MAEGAHSKQEASQKHRDRQAAEPALNSVAHRVAQMLEQHTGLETRAVVPGHIQRGGSPSPYDRVLSTEFGVHASKLIADGVFGVTVAIIGCEVGHNPLSEVAGKTKFVPAQHSLVRTARSIGIELGG